MKNKTICTAIIATLLVLLLIPLVINLLIQSPSIIPTVGTPIDWLTFWGCYLGGIFSALIGFVTLYYSSKKQKLQLQINYKQMELSTLRAKLADCISIFDYSRICAATLYINDPAKYDNILAELNEYNNLICSVGNSWGVLYAHKNNTDAQQNFKEQYEKCIKFFAKDITNIEICIYKLKDGQPNIEQPLYNQIVEITGHENEASKELKILFSYAQDWIAEFEEEIEQLKNKL